MGLIVGVSIDQNYWFPGLLIGIIIGVVTGIIIKDTKYSKANIKGTGSSTIREYPTISEHLKDGWTLSKPTA